MRPDGLTEPLPQILKLTPEAPVALEKDILFIDAKAFMVVFIFMLPIPILENISRDKLPFIPGILEEVLSERLLFIFMPPRVEDILFSDEVMLDPEMEIAIVSSFM
jgi:hypothetical protein